MRAFRWFIIRIAEIFILLFVLLLVLGSGAAGYLFVAYVKQEVGMEVPFGPGVGSVIGAILGFIVAAVCSAAFFLLVEIANNTRRTVTFFEYITHRNDAHDEV
jgi:hypothetical protein